MASLYPKKVNGKTYWYLRQMARVDGKPKMVSERYLGSAADIEATMAGSVAVPERTRHLAFGAVAAGWAMLTRLRVIEFVDEVLGALDMTNLATYIASNDKASLAQRGKAKQKRAGLRLVGLGLVVTRDGGIPLLSHTPIPVTDPTSPSSRCCSPNCAPATPRTPPPRRSPDR